jgi:hypothetical protein
MSKEKRGSTGKAPPTWPAWAGGSMTLPSVCSTAWPVEGPPRPRTQTLAAETRDWQTWLHEEFPIYVKAPFAPRHLGLWAWLDALTPGVRPRPKVDIWPRGGAKSTTTELGCAWVGRTGKRRFGLYVSKTQEMADRHIQAIAALFEQLRVERALNEYGASKGWTRQMLRTAHGFNMLAIGLDKGVRGVKLDELRPDFIVLDDVDDRHDTQATVKRKCEIITESILPAEAPDCATLFVQNRIHANSIATQLADGTADFLLDRLPVVEEPAVVDLATELQTRDDGTTYYAITAGRPTWDGQSLKTCEAQINTWGLTAFLREAQHDVTEPDGGMFSHLDYRRCSWDEVPWKQILATVVWCDPAVTDTDQSDSHGIQADALHQDGTIYRLWSWEQRSSPQATIRQALLKAIDLKAEYLGIETDQGGDTWRSVWQEALRQIREEGLLPQGVRVPNFRSAKAGAGHGSKAHRASQMLVDYEQGRIVHVLGTHTVLEKALRRFPVAKPFDLVDACYWGWTDLRKRGSGGGLIR